jgi:hypothetical protein
MDDAGHPALDLRQEPLAVRLDGRRLTDGDFSRVDLGGGEGAGMRVVDVAFDAGTRHRLEVDYGLDLPDTGAAEPVGWEPDGVRFDFWMSDLYPGRYLEMWIPAPLCHDRFALAVDLEITGTARPHTIATNAGAGAQADGLNRWQIRYPASFTSLSPMLVLAPTDAVEDRTVMIDLPGRATPLALRTLRHLDVDADLAPCEADTAAWLIYLAARYGPWAHGDHFTAFVWGPGRGMEYDGATTASVGALEHEVFHSWFGRGVKPATANDGWIDEAWTSWATASRRREGPRFLSEELPLDLDPVTLYPASPWSRHTPVESYSDGARLWGGIAYLLGGPDRLRTAMAAWYRANAGGLVTTDGLFAHLCRWADVDLAPWWDRYVHGRG